MAWIDYAEKHIWPPNLTPLKGLGIARRV